MKIKQFQQGGEMPQGAEMPQEAPMQQEQGGQGGQDPLMQLAQIAQQALETQDPEAAFAVCEGLLMLIDQMMGEQPQEPVFKKGGKMVSKSKRKGCKKR